MQTHEASSPVPQGHPRRNFWCIYGALFLASALLFHLRFPLNFEVPNFYMEDGHVFAEALAEKGFFGALLTPFNDYFVWGIYFVGQLGRIYSWLFFGGELVTWPRGFALANYTYLAFLATLPLLLFHRWLGYRYLVPLVFLNTFVPLREFDYGVIGTIGNTKFTFLYVAFLLAVYRHRMTGEWWRLLLVDGGFVISAYTNPTVYLLTPFLLLRYVPVWRAGGLKAVLRERTFRSLVVLAAALVPQVLMVLIKGVASNKGTGYLDEPYLWNRTIELFVHRTHAYALLYSVSHYFRDAGAVALFAGLVGLAIWFGGKHRPVLFLALYAATMGTFLFVNQRTGVSHLFHRYKWGGPDNFFYTQNLIFLFFFVLLWRQVFERWRLKHAYPWLASGFLLLFLVQVRHAGTYGRTDFAPRGTGSVLYNAKVACSSQFGERVLFEEYVSDFWEWWVRRERLCTDSVGRYHASVLRYGAPLYEVWRDRPKHPSLVLQPGEKVFQTFNSPQGGLQGIGVFPAGPDFISAGHRIQLLDANCEKVFREITLPAAGLIGFNPLGGRFEPLPESEHHRYCFSVEAVGAPLELKLSSGDLYHQGLARTREGDRPDDLLFELHYPTEEPRFGLGT